MTLAAAWALVGLVALPAIVWLHRRRRRPAPVVVPSLLFLEGEPAEPEAADRVRLDADLLLALAAAALLALAAAGPRISLGGGDVVVRVVMHGGPWEHARRGDRVLMQDADDEAARIRDLVRAEGGRVEFVGQQGDDARALEAARSGTASLRVLIRNRPLASAAPDVREVLVGHPGPRNVGLVAARLEPAGNALRAFGTAWNDGARAESVRFHLVAPTADGTGVPIAERTLDVPPGTARSVTFEEVPALPALSLGAYAAPIDDLDEDDSVSFSRAPVVVGVSPSLPAAHARAVVDALRAVSGEAAVLRDDRAAVLWVGPPEDAPPSAFLFLRLNVVGEGAGVRPPPGAPIDLGPGWVTQDLDVAGCDLVYATDPGSPWPVVRRVQLPRGDGFEFVPDPLAGSPSPADHPVWPLFLENLVAYRYGRPTEAGYRRHGLLRTPGLETTHVGRETRPFDPAWLEGLPPVGAPREASLRPALAAAGVVALLALWRPRRRRALASAPGG